MPIFSKAAPGEANFVQYLDWKEPFATESGTVLHHLRLAYQTFGKYRPGVTPVVWVCHALTANTQVTEWWKGLIGPGNLIDTNTHFVVCANMLGSPYGSTSPLDAKDPYGKHQTGSWYRDFPILTIRDMVKSQVFLRKYLGISHIDLLIGGSMGGQQAIEWLLAEPETVERAVLISTNAKHSPWGIAFNESQRMAIEADTTWGLPVPGAGEAGLQAARAIALLSYRNYLTYQKTQSEPAPNPFGTYAAQSYQRYQGAKLVNRFNAYSYWYLTKAMDSHDVGRGRGGVEAALKRVKARVLSIGIKEDVLFPKEEQEFLAEKVPFGIYREISSLYGHDGFLIETEKLSAIIKPFIK